MSPGFQDRRLFARPAGDDHARVGGEALGCRGDAPVCRAGRVGRTAPRRIAWFDRGPLSDDRLILGGTWSTAYYNGYVYSSDVQQGFDVLEFKDPALARAKGNPMKEFNVQTQPRYIDAPASVSG